MAFAVATWCASGRYPRGSILLVLIYCGAIAVFRGDVGTDTEQYQNMFAAVAMGNQEWLFEGGFAVLATILVEFLPSPEIAVRAVSLLFFLLLGIYAIRSTDDEKWMLISYTLPVFAYQYSMNGLRIGLASAVLLLCAQSLVRNTTVRHQSMLLAPIVFHYSTLISALLLLAAASLRSVRQTVITLIAGSASLVGLLFFASEYLLGKSESYQEMLAPTALSGLGRVAILAILAAGISLGNLRPGAKCALLIPYGLLVSLGVVLTRESYAGLRLLDLLSFVFPLSAMICYQRCSIKIDRRYMLALVFAGCIGGIGVARNFVSSSGEGASPFVPYQFIPWSQVR